MDPLLFKHTILNNGIQLFTQKVEVPFARLHIIIPVGNAHAHAGNTGGAPAIAHLLEHLCMGRSQKYPKLHAFETKLSNCGGDWNAWTNPFYTEYYFEAPATEFQNLLPGFLSQVFEPVLAPEDITLQSSVLQNEGILKKFYPGEDEIGEYKFTEWMSARCYPKAQLYGTKASLSRITPQQLDEYHQHYFSRNILILAAGNIDPEIIKAAALKVRTEPITLIESFESVIWNRRTFTTVPSSIIDAPLYCWGSFTHEVSVENLYTIQFICEYLTNPNTGVLTEWVRKEKGWSYALSNSVWYDKSWIGWNIDIPLQNRRVVTEVRKELHERVRTALGNKKQVRTTAERLIKESCFAYQTISSRLDETATMLTTFGQPITIKDRNRWLKETLSTPILKAAYNTFFAPEVSGEILFTPKK